MEFNNTHDGLCNLIPYTGERHKSTSQPSLPLQGQQTCVCTINCTHMLTFECFPKISLMDCSKIIINDRIIRKRRWCTNIIRTTTTTSDMTITSCITQEAITSTAISSTMQETITNTAISSIVIETISASRPWSTTSVFPTTNFPTANSCGHLATTLHGVYMTVLLVLVAVTITMTTLVVYMCLMMRRAKSGRVPQTTTGTTHTNNMAASDYCAPISLRHFQNTNEGVYM